MEKFLIKPKNDEKDLDFDDNDSEISSICENESEYDSDNTSSELNSGIKDAVDPLTFFSSKELCYYKTIHKFFKKCGDKEIIRMLDIINGDSTISLRVLDWFVTRYSKRKIDFSDSNENTIDSFDVHISYKSELKSYKKKYFDPFRRRRKFYYPLYLNESHYRNKNFFDSNTSNTSNNSREVILLYTTLGQLNFFMWAITNNIINYVEKNLEQISKAMNSNNKDEKKKKQKLITKKKKTKENEDNKEIKEIKETKNEKSEKIKKLSEDKKKNNNNVFNNYYEEFDDSQLILNFD